MRSKANLTTSVHLTLEVIEEFKKRMFPQKSSLKKSFKVKRFFSSLYQTNYQWMNQYFSLFAIPENKIQKKSLLFIRRQVS